MAATPERAPPPLAEPSSFATTMEPMSVASLKAEAWAAACWPMVPSRTRMISWGLTAAAICCISMMSDFSSLCLPEVSMMTTSWSPNFLTPSFAIVTGSLFFVSP